MRKMEEIIVRDFQVGVGAGGPGGFSPPPSFFFWNFLEILAEYDRKIAVALVMRMR
jgi:hypothetical protein